MNLSSKSGMETFTFQSVIGNCAEMQWQKNQQCFWKNSCLFFHALSNRGKAISLRGPFPGYEFQVNCFKAEVVKKAELGTLTAITLEEVNKNFCDLNRKNLSFE